MLQDVFTQVSRFIKIYQWETKLIGNENC
jgi:hypothetical protein